MRRREFISLLGGAATVWPLAARAQQPAVPLVGSLYSVSAAEWQDNIAGFRRGLGEAGFVDGRNVKIEYRWANGQPDLMPKMAADLVGRKVSVILVGGNVTGVRAVLEANKTIPAVFTTAADPVASGLVASLNRPGGNATGVTLFGGELMAKKLELLHELVPNAAKVVVLANAAHVALGAVYLFARRFTTRLLSSSGRCGSIQTSRWHRVIMVWRCAIAGGGKRATWPLAER